MSQVIALQKLSHGYDNHVTRLLQPCDRLMTNIGATMYNQGCKCTGMYMHAFSSELMAEILTQPNSVNIWMIKRDTCDLLYRVHLLAFVQ